MFFDSLQTLCLGFVRIPHIEPISLQIIEQKLVQLCETHIKAESCKALYTNKSNKVDFSDYMLVTVLA